LVFEFSLVFGFFVFWFFRVLSDEHPMSEPDERGYYPPDEPGKLPPPLPPSPAAPPPLPQRVVPLQYGHAIDPVERRRARLKTLGRTALGCVGYIGLGAAWFGFGSLLVRGNSVFGKDRYDLLWAGWLALTLALLGGALFIRLRYRIAGYGYGILAAIALICVGIPLLIIGYCFYAMSGGK
jgi:hypothetical protein